MKITRKSIPALLMAAIVAVLALASPGPPAIAAQQAVSTISATERWYALEMMGARAGYTRISEKTEDGKILSGTEINLSMKRGALAAMKISMKSDWVETEDGKPVSLTSTRQLGAKPEIRVYRFLPEGLEITTGTGASQSKAVVPLPAPEFLPPAARERVIAAALKADQKTIVVQGLDEGPAGGVMPYTATYTVVERTTVEVLGKKTPAIKWKVALDSMPGVNTTEYVDDRGIALRSEMDMGGIKLVQLAADKELALAKVTGPELLASTLVKPDRPIDSPRKLKEAVYLLSVKDGDMPDLPPLPSQKVERLDAKTIRLTVSATFTAVDQPVTEVPAIFTDRSSMLDCKDPVVMELAAQAAKAAKDTTDAAKAEAMRRFVYGFIKEKNLDVGFATASETARTKSGDCTEHGCLLAAMLRAQGIPARVCSGLVYVDRFVEQKNIFGYHMWAQALLPDANGVKRWVDLDAALDESHPFDATHINLGTSALSDTQNENFMVALAPLLGKLKISVETTSK